MICLRPDVINLQDHFHQLSGQKNLRLFTVDGFDNVLLPHIILANFETVYAQRAVVVLDLTGLDLRKGLDGIQPAILSQRERNGLKSISETTEGILLNGSDLEVEKNQKLSSRSGSFMKDKADFLKLQD